MMKQLLILSGKGGTGKTTVASAFIQLSNAVGYADCDVDAPNLHLLVKPEVEALHSDFFGMKVAAIDSEKCIGCGICQETCRFDAISQIHSTYEVNSFACEGCGVCAYICPEKTITMTPSKAGDLMLYQGEAIFSTAKLQMGRGTSGMLVTQVKKNLQIHLVDQSELVIIDGSPGIGCPVIASLSGVNHVLIVTEPSLSGMSDMIRIIETARKFQTPISVCVNKYDTNKALTEKIRTYCIENDIEYVGNIPYDSMAVQAINHNKSIVEFDCESGKAVREIYQVILRRLQ